MNEDINQYLGTYTVRCSKKTLFPVNINYVTRSVSQLTIKRGSSKNRLLMIPDNEELFEVVLTGNEFVHDPEIPNPSIVGTFTDEGLRFTSVISLIDQNQKNIPESQYEYIGYKQTT